MKTLSVMLSGFKDAFEILGNALVVGLNSVSGRIKIFGTLFFVLGFIVLCFNLPYALTTAIGLNNDVGNMNVFEVFLSSVIVDKGRAVFSFFILAVIVFTLFTPIASNSLLSVYNKTSMVSIRKNDTHKVAETIILQLVSVTNLLVFFTAIVVSSVYSYVYSYDVRVFVMCFMVWIVGTSLTGFNGWTVEFVLRKYGPYAKAGLIAVWVVSVAVMFLIFFNSNMLIYFVTDFFIKSFTSVETFIILFILLLVLATGFVYMSFRLGLYTINFTAPYVSDKVKKRNNYKYSGQLGLVFKVLWRNGNVRAPVLLMSIVSLSTLTFVAHEKGTMVGLILAAPMVITMSAAVNFFGIIGSGNSWLFSVTNFTKNVVQSIFFYNIIVSFFVNLLALTPSIVLGYITYETAVSFMVCTVITVVVATVIALNYSVFKPSKYDVHIRGENILSPSKSLTVLMLIVMLGGIPASMLFIYSDIIVQFIVMIIVLVAGVMFEKRYSRLLNSDYNVNNIISQTS